ncbi:beta-lactamase domain-containing protein [Caballeronia hypogeia]|uniref:Beta-lactamase domain-containing protein n=1 Tax=Caballeronia hypogeia TaxID=1777140 RepID=A0A158DML6_9BURK|nr:hypothetical protein [Caballeronia hypogeia]SAK95436.1 beta-lactamase domain-containing protein [Caballeronia hypogeia]
MPGRGAALRDPLACRTAIDDTRRFVRTVIETVRQSIGDHASLKECYERTLHAMEPEFGDWPVFRPVLPFDVVRAYEELTGVEHPTRPSTTRS